MGDSKVEGSNNISLDLTMLEEGEKNLVNEDDIKKIIKRIN